MALTLNGAVPMTRSDNAPKVMVWLAVNTLKLWLTFAVHRGQSVCAQAARMRVPAYVMIMSAMATSRRRRNLLRL